MKRCRHLKWYFDCNIDPDGASVCKKCGEMILNPMAPREQIRTAPVPPEHEVSKALRLAIEAYRAHFK